MSQDMDLGAIGDAAAMIREAGAIAVLTGAGVSAESEIPTYRDPMEGLWAEFDPQKLATPEAFERDPATVSRWYDFRREKCAQALPNPGHLALARLEHTLLARSRKFCLLTQNVDGLHQRAGSGTVVELHGSLMRWRCSVSGVEEPNAPMPLDQYPFPTQAGGYLRPCVVWFGEALPSEAVDIAQQSSTACDLFLTIGTRAEVYPAAGFVALAKQSGAKVIEINPEPSAASGIADVAIRARSGVALPTLVEQAFGPEAAGSPDARNNPS